MEVARCVLAYGRGKAGSASERVIAFWLREECRKAGENALLTRECCLLLLPYLSEGQQTSQAREKKGFSMIGDRKQISAGADREHVKPSMKFSMNWDGGMKPNGKAYVGKRHIEVEAALWLGQWVGTTKKGIIGEQ